MKAKKDKLSIAPRSFSLEQGKLPPQALELEEAVLGAMILEKDTLIQVCDIVKPHHFYKETHQKICEAILQLVEKGKPSDYMMVIDQLKKTGDLEMIGGPYYITHLTSKIASTTNAEFHVRIIIQKYIQRQLIQKSSLAIELAYDDTEDVFELLDEFQSIASDLTVETIQNKEKNTTQLLTEFNESLDKAIEKRKSDTITGVVTGLQMLDKRTDGWQKGDLVIVAARPSMGKTAFALGLMYSIMTILEKPVLIFSLEMIARTLISRMISMETGIPIHAILHGKVNDHDLHKIKDAQSKYYSGKTGLLKIDDTCDLTIGELKARAKRMVSHQRPEIIVVDYIQLMSGGDLSRTGREQEISKISRGLKTLARELNIPVIALSQLSREVERSPGCRPMLSHLRESGAIEQDADLVIFVYRPHYYHTQNKTGFEFIDIPGVAKNVDSKGYADLIIAKHRNGAVGSVPAKFVDNLAKFEDFDHEEYAAVPETADSEPF